MYTSANPVATTAVPNLASPGATDDTRCRLARLAHLALGTLVATCALLPAPASAQRVVVNSGGPPGSFLIPELAAVVVPDKEETAAVVEHAMPAENRAEAYRTVDLQAGDRILAANGKRVRSAKELEVALGEVAVGAAIELGIERQDGPAVERMIVRFPKADPASLPRPQMRMVMIQGGGGEAGEIEVLPDLGAVLRQAEPSSPIEVAGVLPSGDGTFRDGDRLVALAGKPAGALGDLLQQWEMIPVGETVELTLSNGGTERKATITKREAPAGRRVVVQP